jgi:serine/threonine-protein kinase
MSTFGLDPQRAAALSQLLDQALERPPGERPIWLERLPEAYEDLKPHLRDLLSRAADLETRDFLGALPHFTPPKDTLRVGGRVLGPGTLVGPYRLLRELGQGGMGSVWLAERTDGLLKRRVALKLPHGAWPHAQLAERLQRERDILAGLEHPNIARLYDAGLTTDGQPYLALEYVEGRPIDEYCGLARVDVASRVRLFVQVARAVAYAHGKLVLHRDLKPANILVAPDDTVHLLDFGIAKVLADGEVRETFLTQFAGRALSPDYASPEQIRGEPLSVTSDIYSLGVVLYELLAGSRPYRLKRNSRGELEEAILFDDPRRPSELAAPQDRRALRGDLDTIVLQTLKKEPALRYPTVHALIDDLERTLHGQPVSARTDALRYRAGKFVRRHRVGVAAAALLVLALLAGTVGTTIGMIRARRAEAAARTEAATAERYSTFLVDMFEVAAPEGSKGRDVSAGEILEQGAARIRKELVSEPLLQARLLATIGWVYTRQGLYAQARPLLDEAVTLARGKGEIADADLARALVRRGENERKLNETGAAEADDREALMLLERTYGPNDARVQPALTELGLLLRTSDPDQALSYYRRSHDLLVTAHGEADGDAAVLLGNIGSIHRRAHRYRDAKDAYESALPYLKRHFGERDPHVGSVLGNLSIVYRNLGDYARAIEMAQQALAVDSAVSGPDHPDVGVAWQNLALSTDTVGDTRQALGEIERAIKIFGQRLPPEHPLRIQAANIKAGFLIELGQLSDARKTLEDQDATQSAGVDARRSILSGLLILADIERLEKKGQNAQALAERVLADPAVQGDRFLQADARWAHAYALAAQANTADAEAERVRALDLETASAEGTPFPGVFTLAKYYACAGDASRTLAILREAVAGGFHDPIVLHDPAFASLRERPDFQPIAAAVTP